MVLILKVKKKCNRSNLFCFFLFGCFSSVHNVKDLKVEGIGFYSEQERTGSQDKKKINGTLYLEYFARQYCLAVPPCECD